MFLVLHFDARAAGQFLFEVSSVASMCVFSAVAAVAAVFSYSFKIETAQREMTTKDDDEEVILGH